MVTDERSLYEASAAPIHQLLIRTAFSGLTEQEKLYAHYLSCAAWHGARIVLHQTSPEASEIFDLIMELYASCSGDWQNLAQRQKVSADEMGQFLEYAATFLSNIGNYYGSGDQKFVPACDQSAIVKLATTSENALRLLRETLEPLYAVPPISLGFPGTSAQSTYYEGVSVSREELNTVSNVMESHSILPENTRVRKIIGNETTTFQILQASTENSSGLPVLSSTNPAQHFSLVRGDHKEQLSKICSLLSEASKHTSNAQQQKFLVEYIDSFQSGDLEIYRESQKTWVADLSPRVENIFGFVEPYRDPLGIRAEFEALVAISDPDETKSFKRLVENSSTFIRRLPWASNENQGKGPFEKALFEPPDFASIHALAYCSSIIFPGINLPNYNDIRQTCGFKNVIIANRMSAESALSGFSPFIHHSEANTFQEHKFSAYYIWVVLHELLGHGTGKLMAEEAPGQFNFDISDPPTDPLTNSAITSWYRPGQTWTGKFQDLATTVDECRAELVGAYLMDDKELLSLFGFTDNSNITADDLTYNMYLQLGVDGLRGLANYNVSDQKWGQAHSRAHFATLKWLLLDGNDFMRVTCEQTTKELIVHVDRSRILRDGKPSLGRMLLRLHMYRCTANVSACRAYYEDLSKVEGHYLIWKKIVASKKQPKLKYVQANTTLSHGQVQLREYDATNEGIVESWAHRVASLRI